MRRKRGQAGIEYVMIVGAILIIAIPLFFYAIYETNHKVKINQADDAVNTLANAADTVYSLGSGSKKYVWVAIPSGVLSSSVNGSEVSLTLSVFSGQSDIHASSKALLVGSVPAAKGTYRIAVEALEAGIVRIGEDYNDSEPPIVLRVYPDPEPGEIVCPGFVFLGADTDEPATCKYDTADGEYGTMNYSFQGRGLTHTATFYADVNTVYTFYVRCMDPFGNMMNESAIISFETGIPCGAEGTGNLTLNLSDDTGPPEVHLVAPPDGFVRNFSWVDFSYWVTDINNSIDYCLIVVEGINYQQEERNYYSWDSQPEENVTQDITLIIEKGDYSWYVNCTDDSTNHNTGRSAETWDFTVTKTFFESFLNSCAGQCGFQNHIDGFCRENSNKCKDGEVYLQEGDSYCTSNNPGDPSSDTCCCVLG